MFKISQEILKIDYRMLSELIFLFNLKEIQRSAKKNAKVFTSRLWTWNCACFFVLFFDMFDRRKWSKKASKMLPYAILMFFIQLLRQVCSKPGEGYQISLDLFLLVIFLRVRSHGIHHHENPPFGRICLELFPSTKEANPSCGWWPCNVCTFGFQNLMDVYCVSRKKTIWSHSDVKQIHQIPSKVI